jgi:hypothetical protein
MLALIKKFLSDETAAIRLIRGILLGLGLAVNQGLFEGMAPGWEKLGIVLAAFALMMGAGEKNPK